MSYATVSEFWILVQYQRVQSLWLKNIQRISTYTRRVTAPDTYAKIVNFARELYLFAFADISFVREKKALTFFA